MASALSLNGGTIVDVAGDAPGLTLPTRNVANSLYSDADIVVETTPPTVHDVQASMAAGTYAAGAVLSLRVDFSVPIYWSGSMQLALNDGGVATLAAGNIQDTSILIFTDTVQAGQNANPLDEQSTTALSLNGTIKDAAGNNANLTLPAPGTVGSLALSHSTLVVDTTTPSVVSVTSTDGNGTVGPNAAVPITVNFNEPVYVAGSAPELLLNDGGVAVYSGGSGTGALTFVYKVGATGSGQNTRALDVNATNALILTGGTIQDVNGLNAVLTLPSPGSSGSLSSSKQIAVDTTAPTVVAVSSTTPNGTYDAGSSIIITVQFSKPVFFSGSLKLQLNDDYDRTGQYTLASVVGGNGTNTIQFLYKPTSPHAALRLDYTSTSALLVNGSQITDASGNVANVTLPQPGAPGTPGTSFGVPGSPATVGARPARSRPTRTSRS